MEMKKYKQAMQFLLKPKYLTKEFIVQYPEPSDEQQGTMDEVMPTPTPYMDNVMPVEPGMEDPSLRQVELAEGGTPAGKKTKKITRVGKPVYENSEGKMVSEQSRTLKLGNLYYNVPSIHDGKKYTDEQLVELLDKNLISPTSVHSNLEEALDESKFRSSTLFDTEEDYGQQLSAREGSFAEGGVVQREGFKDGINYTRNPTGKNQYQQKSIEEIKNIIESNPDLTAKDLEGYGKETRGRLLTRDDLRRAKEAGIQPKISGKRIYKDRRERDIRRKEKIQPSQGQPISIKGSRTTGSNIEFGHVYPFSELAPQTNKMTGYIPADMNKKLTKFNNEAYKIVKQQEDIVKNDPTNKRKIMELNAKAKLNSENAVKTLGPKYKGLIGHLRIDPDNLTVDKKGGDWQKSFAGISGEEIVYKDLSPKDRIAFEKQISNDLKNNPELVQQIQKAGFVCRKKIGGPIDLNCITKDLIKEGDKFKTGTPLQKKAAFNKFKNLSLKAGNFSLQAGKGALKILGAVLTPLIAYDTYTAYKEGKPIEEALEYGLLGTNIIGGVRDEMKLTPQEREARGVEQQYEREQEDISGLSSDFYVPSNLSVDEAAAVSKEAANRITAERAAKEKQLAAQREYEGDPGIQDDSGLYATGGRVGLKDAGDPKDKPILPMNPMMDEGPQDPSKRTFIQGAGGVGLAGLLLGTGLLKLGKSVAVPSKIGSMIKNTTAPSWMEALITKVMKEGTDIPIPKKPGATAEKISIKELEFKNPENGKTETITLKIDETKDSIDVDYMGYDTLGGKGVNFKLSPKEEIVYSKDGKYLTSKKVKDEYKFYAHEAEPQVVNWDGDIEFDGEVGVNKIIDLNSDISGLKSFVTGGKGVDKKVAKIKKETVDKIEKNPAEYIEEGFDYSYYDPSLPTE